MQFEQPAELNRYVDPTIPLTWAVRWRFTKPGLPLLVFCSVLMVEQAAFRLWLNDRSLISELPLLLACALFPIVCIPLVFEAQVGLAHRTKRRITLDARRVSISPAKSNRIPWKQISGWRFQPVASAPGLTKLTVEYALGVKGKIRREWSMVLRQPDQEHAFLSELDLFRQKELNSVPVVRLAEASAPTAANRSYRGMVAFALGLYLLLHGLPSFLVGLTPPTRHSDDSSSDSRFSRKERAKLRQTIVQHFSSPQQFRIFLLVVGGGLTAVGAGLYFWGLSAVKRPNAPAHSAGSAIPGTAPLNPAGIGK